MTDLAAARRGFYPNAGPYAAGMLKVSDLHTLHYEECGNPDGKPVVMLHGGPGGAINPLMPCTHDPAAYRIIMFDQRGCGQSTPYAELRENTTWDLVADMEQLREHLGVERWQVCGGSWGSALALAYAQRHLERVTEIVVRGIFTLRPRELRWFYQEGADAIFPEAWEAFVAPIPADERGDLIAAYHRRLTGDDETVQLACAVAWSVWEAQTLSLHPAPWRARHFAEPAFAVAFARIECHYFFNGGFFEPQDELIRNAGRLAGIPGVIIQGRYDMVTPMFTAWDLSNAWLGAELIVVPDAGHAPTEAGVIDAMVRVSDRFRVG